MSKRKRASLGKTSSGADQPAGEQSTTSPADDAAVKDDMVHVTPDLLAGSPDIFAPKWSPDEPAKGEAPEGGPPGGRPGACPRGAAEARRNHRSLCPNNRRIRSGRCAAGSRDVCPAS